ncbi:MAG: PEP-CTERM sorting domain-containing protein [Thiotrichales bacterium]|nr:PEP-CTERM sorting domain-containing protein [Thiotrichales bacterium]
MKNKLYVPIIVGLLSAPSVQAAAIDLNTWNQEGASSAGNWVVSSDGSSVNQTINGEPTYFVSDTNYINKDFDGSFEVQTTSDDDFIGFVFGWNGTNDYYLFDWKQTEQDYRGLGQEGFTLSRITGSDVELWDHSGTDIQVLATDYGTGKGWADNTMYDFKLTYTTSNIVISIDGNNIFSETGSFDNGKFGFYNYSQSNVFYQGFEESIASPVPEPPTYLLMMVGLMGLLARYKFKK